MICFIGVFEQRLVFSVHDGEDRKLRDIILSLTPFRKVVKDYFLVCESYYAAIKKLGPSQIEALESGKEKQADKAVERFVAFLMKAQAVRRMGSAALDLAYVACGRFDGFWEVALHPWDMAAGVLIVEEAGGRFTDHAGNATPAGGNAISTNGRLHDRVLYTRAGDNWKLERLAP